MKSGTGRTYAFVRVTLPNHVRDRLLRLGKEARRCIERAVRMEPIVGLFIPFDQPDDVESKVVVSQTRGRQRAGSKSFPTMYRVELVQFPIAKQCRPQEPAGQLIVTDGDLRQPAVVSLPIMRYLTVSALVQKSLELTDATFIDVTDPSFRCSLPDIEEAFNSFSADLDDPDMFCKVKSEIRGYIRHLRATLEKEGVKGLIQGDMRHGYFLATHPANVTFIAHEHSTLRRDGSGQQVHRKPRTGRTGLSDGVCFTTEEKGKLADRGCSQSKR